MSRFVKNSLRFVLVAVGIITLTSFTIDATDTLNSSQTALSIFTQKVFEPECREGMTRVKGPDYDFCIDMYEVSPSDDCLYKEPGSVIDTSHNIADKGCVPVSSVDKKPWTFVAVPQAEQLCAKVGKSLPTPEEWYVSAMGTPDNSNICNLKSDLLKTGLKEDCISGVGAFDMVGNVWEFVKGEATDGKYLDREFPEEGYIEMVDDAGIAVNTTSTPNIIYNNDYFWTDKNGQYALMRGGYYGSRDDGGVYATHAKTDKNFSSGAIGFRCVEQLR